MEITPLLIAWQEGDRDAFNQIVSITYEELRKLAQSYLSQKRGPRSLAATALVHEAYLRLNGRDAAQVHDRGHFFALAAKVLRSVLVNHIRDANTCKRGGGLVRVTLSGHNLPGVREPDVLALHQALERLEQIDPIQARIVELKFFGGLSMAEIAQVLHLSDRGLFRRYEHARTWLYRYLRKVATS